MNYIINVPYLCVFLCMITAILLSFVKKPKLSFYVTLTVSLIVAVSSTAFLFHVTKAGISIPYTMGKFPAPFGNEIKAGPLQALFASVFALVLFLSMLGGKHDMFEDVNEHKMGLACVMLNMTLASLLILTYTNDVFTAYVFIEISTIAACALVVIKENGLTLMATLRYLFMSLLGSGLFLFGIIILYAITGHLLMPQLNKAVYELFESGSYRVPLFISAAMVTAGLGIKSAMFPFHRWLPGAHGNATTTSSAVLSGLVLKGYAVLLITMYVRVFTLDLISEIGLNYIVLILGFMGMIFGSVMAIRESHIKRMLAYSSVAQLGYVFMGIGICTEAGIAAACFQIIAHACTKPLLFASAGRLSSSNGHKKDLHDLRGTARLVPLAGVGFSVGALSMIGIPLFAGFTSKVTFAIASAGINWQLISVLAMLALSSVLNALYYVPALLCIWSSGADTQISTAKPDKAFAIAAIIFIICIFVLGIYFTPVMNVIDLGLMLT